MTEDEKFKKMVRAWMAKIGEKHTPAAVLGRKSLDELADLLLSQFWVTTPTSTSWPSQQTDMRNAGGNGRHVACYVPFRMAYSRSQPTRALV